MAVVTDVRPPLSLPTDDPAFVVAAAARSRSMLERVIQDAWASAGVETPEGLQARVMQTHYAPWRRTRLLVRVDVLRSTTGKKPRVQYLFLQTYPSLADARARAEAASAKALSCFGPAAFVIEPWSAVAWALPNGPMLRRCDLLFSRARAHRFAARLGLTEKSRRPRPKRPELIRYVPRRRAVFRHRVVGLDGPHPYYVKLHARSADSRDAERNLREVNEHLSGPLVVPRLIARERARRAIVMEELPGRRLTPMLDARGAWALPAVGVALAALHRSTVAPRAVWTPERELARLNMSVEDLECAIPVLAPRTSRLADELAARRAELTFDVGPIHGNLFGDQVLVAPEGAVGFVDWDDLSWGDPLYDLGRLTAHVAFQMQRRDACIEDIERAARELFGGYVQAGGDIHDERLRWHVATSLVVRAKISALRALPEGWLADVEAAIGLAEAVVSGALLVDDIAAGSQARRGGS